MIPSAIAFAVAAPGQGGVPADCRTAVGDTAFLRPTIHEADRSRAGGRHG
jgi:hypothetical protein